MVARASPVTRVVSPTPTGRSGSSTQPNLILGFCTNYRFEMIESFVASVLALGDRVKLCLFTNGMDETFYQVAARYGIRIEDASPFIGTDMHVLNRRYFAYRDFLAVHGSAYGRVLLTDIRDVFFQSDPFAVRHPNAVCFALEDTKIKWETLNQSWIRDVYGEDVLNAVMDDYVSCAGTTVGTVAGISRYLDTLCTELDVRSFDRMGNYDQGIHNYIVWKLRPDWGWVDTADSIFNTVGCTSADRITIVDDLAVIDGKVSPVVHQWDRHEILRDYVGVSPRFRISSL